VQQHVGHKRFKKITKIRKRARNIAHVFEDLAVAVAKPLVVFQD
jgi:hypothetical protein